MNSITKFVLIVVIVAGCLIALILIRGETGSGQVVHDMHFFENADDWKNCDFYDCVLSDDSSSVIFAKGDRESMLVTGIISSNFRFDELMLSWNSDSLPTGSAISFEVAVSNDKETWYDFHYQTYGTVDSLEYGDLVSLPDKIDLIGRMDTDIMKLLKPMKFAKVTVRVFLKDPKSSIRLRRLSLSLASHNATWSELSGRRNDSPEIQIGKVKLAVPYYTQRGLPSDLSGNCCSPTSVTMVLNYYDKGVIQEDFCRLVYDPYHDMFGNWPYNVEAAYLEGLSKTWVEIHSSFDELYQEISEGKPVVISIAYGYDELPNSPIHEASVGHLITVVGFDGPDTVICNDPAGHGPEDGIVNYPRKELERVWLDHGGVAYHLWP